MCRLRCHLDTGLVRNLNDSLPKYNSASGGRLVLIHNATVLFSNGVGTLNIQDYGSAGFYVWCLAMMANDEEAWIISARIDYNYTVSLRAITRTGKYTGTCGVNIAVFMR